MCITCDKRPAALRLSVEVGHASDPMHLTTAATLAELWLAKYNRTASDPTSPEEHRGEPISLVTARDDLAPVTIDITYGHPEATVTPLAHLLGDTGVDYILYAFLGFTGGWTLIVESAATAYSTFELFAATTNN